MNPALEETMNALLPGCRCPHATGSCSGLVRLDPLHGHAPRGYAGATGNLDEVCAIFVFAEPGNPYPGESYRNASEAWEFATECFRMQNSAESDRLISAQSDRSVSDESDQSISAESERFRPGHVRLTQSA